MIKYTQKQLRELAQYGHAIDLSQRGTIEDRDQILEAEGYLHQIGYASGVNGCSGKLLEGSNTKQLYVIVGHTQAIYVY